jgi:MFS family permease
MLCFPVLISALLLVLVDARPIGSVLFGHIGDTKGRRTTLLLSLCIMAVPTVGSAAMSAALHKPSTKTKCRR